MSVGEEICTTHALNVITTKFRRPQVRHICSPNRLLIKIAQMWSRFKETSAFLLLHYCILPTTGWSPEKCIKGIASVRQFYVNDIHGVNRFHSFAFIPVQSILMTLVKTVFYVSNSWQVNEIRTICRKQITSTRDDWEYDALSLHPNAYQIWNDSSRTWKISTTVWSIFKLSGNLVNLEIC